MYNVYIYTYKYICTKKISHYHPLINLNGEHMDDATSEIHLCILNCRNFPAYHPRWMHMIHHENTPLTSASTGRLALDLCSFFAP